MTLSPASQSRICGKAAVQADSARSHLLALGLLTVNKFLKLMTCRHLTGLNRVTILHPQKALCGKSVHVFDVLWPNLKDILRYADPKRHGR